MPGYNQLSVSDGTGEAVLANIESNRSIGATTLDVDSVDNWPAEFIFTTGTLNANGYINNASMTIAYGHLLAGDIIIDGYAPGYTDVGNTAGQVAIIKPNTNWADEMTRLARVAHENNGQPKPTSLNPTGMIVPYAGFTAPSGWLLCDGAAVSRSTYADLFALLNPTVGTFTVTIATPGVVTLTAHGLETSDSIYITTTGSLPTGLAANTRYWVIKVNANSFRLATSQANADAGTAINTSGSQSGVHTLRRTPYGVGDGATTFNIPDLRGRVAVGLDASQTEFNTLGKRGGNKLLQTHTHPNSRAQFINVVVQSGSGNTSMWGGPANVDTGSTGGGDSQNLQPYAVSTYLVKT